jgi:hypothetical protein
MNEGDRASKPRHNRPGRVRAVPVEAGRNFHLFQTRKYVTRKVSVLCIFIHLWSHYKRFLIILLSNM